MLYLPYVYIERSYHLSPKGIANRFSLCRLTDTRPLTFCFLASIVIHIGRCESYVRVTVGGISLCAQLGKRYPVPKRRRVSGT